MKIASSHRFPPQCLFHIRERLPFKVRPERRLQVPSLLEVPQERDRQRREEFS